MNCDKFASMLDAYIDGEIAGEDLRQFMDHADTCENCRLALREAEMLRDMMKDMDDEIAVPLQAQAAWRGAVKAEAKKIRMHRAMKFAYAAAAALVVLVGSTVAFNAVNEKNAVVDQAQPMMVRSMDAGAGETEELIAVDGAADAASAKKSSEYTAFKKIETDGYDAACMTVEQLCQEYSGAFTAETSGIEGKNSASYRVELPGEYMSDFLSAMSRLGEETASEIGDAESDTAVILIQIIEK